MEEGDPVIDVASTLITLDLHESQIVSASISGEQVSENESHELIWETSNPDVVSLLQTETNVSKGNSSSLTAKKAGEAVITVTHPDYDVSVDIWVKVPDVQELDISLSQVYMELFKDDGSVTIEAMVTNGTSDDYNNITWSAAKVGGVNIVSISNQAQGRTCNIVPRNPGQTTVRAQLPNGKYADCIVVVNDAAEILLSTKAVHVNPGYSETVSYTLNPPDAKVEWLALTSSSGGSFGEDASQFFTFTVNEAAQTITINGIREGTGSIQGFFSSTSGETASITVYVEYNYDVNFDTSVVSAEPTKDITVPFSVFPFDLEVVVEIAPAGANLAVKEIQHDKGTGKGNIILTPLGEQKDIRVQFSATNPNDKVNTPIIREKTVHLYYDDYTITPRFHYRSGSFSRYDETNNMLYLGDGEEYVFYLDIAEDLANIENLKVSYQAASNADMNYQLATEKEGGLIVFEEDDKGEEDGERRWRIKHTKDTIDPAVYYLLTRDLQFKYTEEEYYTDLLSKDLQCGETYIVTDSAGRPILDVLGLQQQEVAVCANGHATYRTESYYDNGVSKTRYVYNGISHNTGYYYNSQGNWAYANKGGPCLGTAGTYYYRSEVKPRTIKTDTLKTFNPNQAITSWEKGGSDGYEFGLGSIGSWGDKTQGEGMLPVTKNNVYSDAFGFMGTTYGKVYFNNYKTPNLALREVVKRRFKITKTNTSTSPSTTTTTYEMNWRPSEWDPNRERYGFIYGTRSETDFWEGDIKATLKPVYEPLAHSIVLSESTFKGNANYWKSGFELKKWDNGFWGFGSGYDTWSQGDTQLHAYAEKTTSKDTDLSAAQPQGQGQIIITYNAVGSSTEIQKIIPVTVQVRNCEYHCEPDWKKYTSSDGNTYWKRG